jgi:hypothetical protein
MAVAFATSFAGLFTWPTFVRLWLGRSDADRARSPASIGRTGLGWFGQAHHWAGLTGLAVIVAFLAILVWLAYDSRARHWGSEVRAWL